MDEATYPRPRCATCGMPLRLVPEKNKWFCETCKTFPEITKPPIIEEERDLAKPAGRWIRFILVVLIIAAIAFVRIFIIG